MLLVQFRDYLANECKHPEKYNCTSCDTRLKCLNKGGFEIETFMRDKGGKRIKKQINAADDIWTIIKEIEQYNQTEGNPQAISYFEHFLAYEICPIPFIEPEQIELLNMIDLTGKIRSDKYLDTPAILISIINRVNAERGRLMRLRMAKDGK